MLNEVMGVGAGISGLSAASLFAKRGVPVRVFEKAADIGGRTMSTRYRGHILDNGFYIMPFYKTSAVYRMALVWNNA